MDGIHSTKHICNTDLGSLVVPFGESVEWEKICQHQIFPRPRQRGLDAWAKTTILNLHYGQKADFSLAIVYIHLPCQRHHRSGPHPVKKIVIPSVKEDAMFLKKPSHLHIIYYRFLTHHSILNVTGPYNLPFLVLYRVHDFSCEETMSTSAIWLSHQIAYIYFVCYAYHSS